MIKIGSPKQKQMEMFFIILTILHRENRAFNLKASDIRLIDFEDMKYRLNGQESENFEYALMKLNELGLIHFKETNRYNFYYKKGEQPIPYQDWIDDRIGYSLGFLSSVKNLILTGKGLVIMDILSMPNMLKTNASYYTDLSKDDKMVFLVDWYKNFLAVVVDRIQL